MRRRVLPWRHSSVSRPSHPLRLSFRPQTILRFDLGRHGDPRRVHSVDTLQSRRPAVAGVKPVENRRRHGSPSPRLRRSSASDSQVSAWSANRPDCAGHFRPAGTTACRPRLWSTARGKPGDAGEARHGNEEDKAPKRLMVLVAPGRRSWRQGGWYPVAAEAVKELAGVAVSPWAPRNNAAREAQTDEPTPG
jgi:hypothetical protein